MPEADGDAPPMPMNQPEEKVEYDEPHSDLPPCPQPFDELDKAVSKPDWAAVLPILDSVLNRDDCDPGRWRDLTWAHGEVREIIRLKQNVKQPNPIAAIRSLQLAVLSMLDNPELLVEKTILVTEVSTPNTMGYRRVEGNDPVTGDSFALLSPQSIEPGQEISFWVIDQANAPEAGLQHDMIQYVRLVNSTVAHRAQSARDRLPEGMRNDSAASENTDSMTVSETRRKARESTRLAAEKTLAELEVANPQFESAIQQGKARLSDREKQLTEIIGGFLQFEFDVRDADKIDPSRLAPIKP